MPYLNKLRHRMVRRPGLSGLGDYSQWLSNLSITDENGTRISFASASPVEQAQIINATAGTAYFGQPAGAAISIQVNSKGGTNDIPAYTLTGGIGGGTQSLPYMANRAGQIVGQEISRASNILTCGLQNCTPGAATASGGVLTSSLPANFQNAAALPTQTQAAAAFPGGGILGTNNSSNSNGGSGTTTASTGIPSWLVLVGAVIVVILLMRGNQ